MAGEPVLKPIDKPPIKVFVRWTDGYFEEFECTEFRAGAYLIWMHLTTGENRSIPTWQVRWFSQYPESHERLNDEGET